MEYNERTENETEVQPSHFSFNEDSRIRETTNRKAPADNEPAPGAEIITMLFKKYGFLTRRLLSKCLIKKGHTTIDTVKSLRKMQQQGILSKYTIETGRGDDISIFCLSEKTRSSLHGLKEYRYDMENIPYIMETLATAQWSISLKNEKKAAELMYEVCQGTEKGILRIPSLVRFIIRPGKCMYLAAMPVCRGKDPERVNGFLEKLDSLNEYLDINSGRYRSSQVVLLCESVMQIEETCRILSRFTELAGNFYLYTTDAITGDDDIEPLEILYGATVKNSGEAEITVFSLKGKGAGEMVKKTVRRVREKMGVTGKEGDN